MEFIAILHLSKTSLESYFGHFEPMFDRKPLYFGKLAAKSLGRFSLAAPCLRRISDFESTLRENGGPRSGAYSEFLLT